MLSCLISNFSLCLLPVKVFEIEGMNTKASIKFGRESYLKQRPVGILLKYRKHKYLFLSLLSYAEKKSHCYEEIK